MKEKKLWVTTVQNEFGVTVYTAWSEGGALKQLADYCREWWHEVNEVLEDDEIEMPKKDEDIVKAYFDNMSEKGEFYTLEVSIPTR
jgi:ketopantoate reductase